MNRQQKKGMVKKARRLVWKKFPAIKGRNGHCIYYAWGLVITAMRQGLRLIPQGGTCYWPRVTDETDDGVEGTQFGYEWSPESPISKIAKGLGSLPEMHVWAVDPATESIIDLTSGIWPDRCKQLTGMNWKAPMPPDFLWTTFNQLPKGVIYEPNKDACQLVAEVMVKISKGEVTHGKHLAYESCPTQQA